MRGSCTPGDTIRDHTETSRKRHGIILTGRGRIIGQ
jgi:hypothetical protein